MNDRDALETPPSPGKLAEFGRLIFSDPTASLF
jgi:hypothetical protein